MPIFDYACPHCSYKIELFTSPKSDRPVICTECGFPMEKLMPAPGLLRTNFHDKPSVKKR